MNCEAYAANDAAIVVCDAEEGKCGGWLRDKFNESLRRRWF
jgi:hypothetical protein